VRSHRPRRVTDQQTSTTAERENRIRTTRPPAAVRGSQAPDGLRPSMPLRAAYATTRVDARYQPQGQPPANRRQRVWRFPARSTGTGGHSRACQSRRRPQRFQARALPMLTDRKRSLAGNPAGTVGEVNRHRRTVQPRRSAPEPPPRPRGCVTERGSAWTDLHPGPAWCGGLGRLDPPGQAVDRGRAVARCAMRPCPGTSLYARCGRRAAVEGASTGSSERCAVRTSVAGASRAKGEGQGRSVRAGPGCRSVLAEWRSRVAGACVQICRSEQAPTARRPQRRP